MALLTNGPQKSLLVTDSHHLVAIDPLATPLNQAQEKQTHAWPWLASGGTTDPLGHEHASILPGDRVKRIIGRLVASCALYPGGFP